jgi:UDP-N-acetylglucosamine 2-epimerase (non-hydrolysing)
MDEHKPSCVLVVGDVNSTLACTLVAVKKGVPVVHVEAGLRSWDRRMPEEINRVLTDQVADRLYTTERSALANLLREGVAEERVCFAGNVMIDSLLSNKPFAKAPAATLAAHGASPALVQGAGGYGVVTLHRPSNVDDAAMMARIGGALKDIAAELPLIFPVHPRTRGNLAKFGVDLGPNITLVGPQAYMAFLNLWKDAAVVLTDSGGMQEETTALGVPCITIRENTERPVTVEEGSNVLAGTDPAVIVAEARKVLRGQGKQGRRPQLWDGNAAVRIVDILAGHLATRGATHG